MLPLTRIIAPTDFSDRSYRALHVAEELALAFSAELIMLHTVEPTTTVAPGADLGAESTLAFGVAGDQRALTRRAEQRLDSDARARVSPRVELRKIVVTGKPASRIVELAAEERADLIVMATHGRTGLRRLLHGSVAEKVVRTAGCPVLAVHGGEEEVEQDDR